MDKELQKEIFEKCTQNICSKGPLVTDVEVGEIICERCGLVLVEKTTETGSEHHTFTKEDYIKNSRVGPKLKLSFIDSLSTVINSHNVDSSGKRLSGKMKSEFYRLRKWDRRSKSEKNKIF